eukprot:scaffold220514_cov19-Tisochrysis_lutea.AAC.2
MIHLSGDTNTHCTLEYGCTFKNSGRVPISAPHCVPQTLHRALVHATGRGAYLFTLQHSETSGAGGQHAAIRLCGGPSQRCSAADRTARAPTVPWATICHSKGLSGVASMGQSSTCDEGFAR